MLCSKHFEDNCFEKDRKLSDSIGFGKRQACLNSEALTNYTSEGISEKKEPDISNTSIYNTHCVYLLP